MLTNVIKNQIEEEEKEINDNSMEENFAVGEVNNEEDQIQNDSFTLNVQDAVTKGFMNADSANWSIEQNKGENRRVTLTYKAFKKCEDLKDFAHTLARLHKNATK